MNKKPYLKKIMNISGFNVWEVDGDYIRTNIDEEFTNYGQHYLFKFIPKDEFWIDKGRVPGEEKFYVDSMLVMNRLLKKDVSHAIAVKKADAVEKNERNKFDLSKGKIKFKKIGNDVINKIHKKIIKKYSTKNFKIWIINGRKVRDIFFIDFTEGGHDKVYKFIPSDEIWIDNEVEPREIKFVLIHELHERNLMSHGMKYPQAHRSSSQLEYQCRHNHSLIDKTIKHEIKSLII